jgi:glycosyltransferase involved in cell wall biosynthesis
MKNRIKILYLNYFSLPEIKSGKEKIDKFGFSYRFLSEFDPSFEVVVIDCIGEEDDFTEGNVQYNFRKKLYNSRFKLPTKINKEIIELNPDVILLQGFRFIHFADILKRKIPNARLIVQHHAEQIPKSKLKQSILSSYNKKVDAYIFSARSLAKYWVEKGIIDAKKPIIELPEIATDFKRGEDPKVPNSFIWVGRLNQNKDPITAIKGIAPYFKKNPDARLRMFYHVDKLKSSIIEEVKKLDIESQVELVGKIPNAKLEAEYQKSQFFLLTSHYEGGSLAMMESMACGCIPIVSDIPANRKFTNNGNLGVLFEVNTSLNLSQKLDALAGRNLFKESLDVTAYFESHLSSKAIAQGIERYLKTK